MKYQPGHVFTTDGTHDVTDRVAKPRLIIYEDGYGAPVFAELGDYVVMRGVSNPPGVTERGVAAFEPTKLIYCGPDEFLAMLVARHEFDKQKQDLTELRRHNKPIPTVWVYQFKPYQSTEWAEKCGQPGYMAELAPTYVWLGRPDYGPEIDKALHFLETTKTPPPLQTAGLVTVNEDGEEVPYEGS